MSDTAIEEIWLVQPLAFARGGSSDTPCDAFDWGAADLSPHGTGRTTIIPAPGLSVHPQTGEVSEQQAPDIIRFKDADGKIKPVCPFFELHGRWRLHGKYAEGPITPAILKRFGLTAKNLHWQIEFCNAKAAHWTQAPGDRVSVTVPLRGDECVPKALLGESPDCDLPLVPKGTFIPLGSVQLTCPTRQFPEFRLRFTPGKGRVYAPCGTNARLKKLKEIQPSAAPVISQLFEMNKAWAEVDLLEENCILNPAAAWPHFFLFNIEKEVTRRLIACLPDLGNLLTLEDTDMSELLRHMAGPTKDVRNLPPGLYAYVTEPPNAIASLGLIDDFGDGLITCVIDGLGIPAAVARIVSTPPDFAPDRRPIVSIADGLADRTRRADVRASTHQSYDGEIRDLLDRAFETLGLTNLDVTNDYFQTENAATASRPGTPFTSAQARQLLWPSLQGNALERLPLTTAARDAHRRNTVDVFFRALVHEHPDFMTRWIREPAGPQRLYDQKMPGLMRGGALLQTLPQSVGVGQRGAGERVMSDFKGRHFEGEIVLWAVRWYCRYGISYRDLEQMMGERGVSVDHSTIYRWVQKYAPEIEKRLRWQWRGPLSTSWRVDETYVKVRGQWTYLYRAIDKYGNTIDFYLSPTRNTAAAKRFLGKALNGLKDWEKPTVINTDKAPTYAAALAELKKEGKCPNETLHRQVKYLNNIIEADHGKLKQLIRPVRGFKTLKTAYATIKGFEVMHALRKGQASAFNITNDICGEARIVERAFGLGASALTEVVQFVSARLEFETA